jgi:capsular polysaccharide biosynthesis protein
VTRTHDKRGCLNREEVERLFTEHGFQVVAPEEHPLSVQAHLFHDAKVVAGFAGSGMFNVMFSDRPGKHIITVGSELYRAVNEYMIGAVRGHRLDIAFCDSTLRIPEPTGKQRRTAPYVFDAEREGRWLEGILREL